ncbi:hypothetical protein H9Q09_11775 [Aurantimonas sp. DM33-3]|uniref:DUF6894 family protein n=1 Tax=Aurantimonas sp. DM33-3 TaxID=2766955 RepID=UPI001652AABA|nr:hypothetical protein [Aurantimonas sp. DM33-3]MBC6716886.1 hypothetical protein [Aurantimonas sp. DM33-3]
MPFYFFDVQDQEEISEDDVGIECQSLEAVRRTAVNALPDIAKSAVLDGEHHLLAVTVRDEAGNRIFKATLTVDAGWLNGNQKMATE